MDPDEPAIRFLDEGRIRIVKFNRGICEPGPIAIRRVRAHGSESKGLGATFGRIDSALIHASAAEADFAGELPPSQTAERRMLKPHVRFDVARIVSGSKGADLIGESHLRASFVFDIWIIVTWK